MGGGGKLFALDYHSITPPQFTIIIMPTIHLPLKCSLYDPRILARLETIDLFHV